MPYIEMVSPIRQKSWQWPAVANFVLGGAGSGLFLLGSLFVGIDPTWMVNSQFVPIEILSPLIVCLGFFSVFFEAGKPSRGYLLLNSLSHSWMSIEGLVGGVFILSSIASFFFGSFLVYSIAVLSAAMLLISQGFMVVNAVAVRTWNEKWVVVVFVGSGFMTAVGVMLLNSKSISMYGNTMVSFLLAIVLFNLIAWFVYLFGKFENDYKDSVKYLHRSVSLFVVAGFGHILPFFLLCFVFSGYADPFSFGSSFLSFSIGLMLVYGGISQKKGLVLVSGYYRRIVLKNE